MGLGRQLAVRYREFKAIADFSTRLENRLCVDFGEAVDYVYARLSGRDGTGRIYVIEYYVGGTKKEILCWEKAFSRLDQKVG